MKCKNCGHELLDVGGDSIVYRASAMQKLGLVLAGLFLGMALLLSYDALFVYPKVQEYDQLSASYEKVFVPASLYYNHLVLIEEVKSLDLEEAYSRFNSRYYAALIFLQDMNVTSNVIAFSACQEKSGGDGVELSKCNVFNQNIDERVYEILTPYFADKKLFSTDPKNWAIEVLEGGQ